MIQDTRRILSELRCEDTSVGETAVAGHGKRGRGRGGRGETQ